MPERYSIEAVRMLVRRRIARYANEPTVSLSESILIRDSFYCGRRFSAHGFQAIWFHEESEVKLFDPSGRLVQSLDLVVEPAVTDCLPATRRAA